MSRHKVVVRAFLTSDRRHPTSQSRTADSTQGVQHHLQIEGSAMPLSIPGDNGEAPLARPGHALAKRMRLAEGHGAPAG